MEQEECVSRWKSLRDKFVREIKTRKSGDPGPPYKPSWLLFTLMEFLSNTIHHRETVSISKLNDLLWKYYDCSFDVGHTATSAGPVLQIMMQL